MHVWLCATAVIFLTCSIRHTAVTQITNDDFEALKRMMAADPSIARYRHRLNGNSCRSLIRLTQVFIRNYRRLHVRPRQAKLQYLKMLRHLQREARRKQRDPVQSIQCSQMLHVLLDEQM